MKILSFVRLLIFRICLHVLQYVLVYNYRAIQYFVYFSKTMETETPRSVSHSSTVQLVFFSHSEFEETFKLNTPANNEPDGEGVKPEPTPRKKTVQKDGLLDTNRSQNVAIARRKITCSSEELKDVITQ